MLWVWSRLRSGCSCSGPESLVEPEAAELPIRPAIILTMLIDLRCGFVLYQEFCIVSIVLSQAHGECVSMKKKAPSFPSL